MPEFRETIDIDASPEEAWSVIGDLRSVERWVPRLERVEVNGLTRVCTMADGTVQHELISDYSEADRSYRYAIEGGLPVRDNRGSFRVEERPGGGSRIVWESSFEPATAAAGDEIVEMWRGALPGLMQNLKAVIEGRGAGRA